MAAAIAASNGVLPLVGGMALSEASLLGEASSRQIHLAPEGCTLVLLDGNSISIGGTCTVSKMKMECYNQLVKLKGEVIQMKALFYC